MEIASKVFFVLSVVGVTSLIVAFIATWREAQIKTGNAFLIRVQELMPMLPWQGPPLPRRWGIQWRGRKD